VTSIAAPVAACSRSISTLTAASPPLRGADPPKPPPPPPPKNASKRSEIEPKPSKFGLWPPRLRPSWPVAVVDLALVGVGKDLVGLGGLLELLLGLRVVVVDVGVQLAGELAERLLDLGLVGVAANAEHLVGVALHDAS